MSTDIFNKFDNFLHDLCKKLINNKIIKNDIKLQNIKFEIPKDENNGDLSTNALLVLSNVSSLSFKEFSEYLINELNTIEEVDSVELAGPGFINLYLKNTIWYSCIENINNEGKTFGFENVGNNQNINVEYVSANPTGPLHIGHCRGAVIGDTIANLCNKMGFNVSKEYYVNDAGGQINELIKSVLHRYKLLSGTVENSNDADIEYKGEYLQPVTEYIYNQYGTALLDMNQIEYSSILRDCTIDFILKIIKEDLKKINIEHDVFFSEMSLIKNNELVDCLDTLRSKDLLYYGVLPKPKKIIDVEYDEREQELFKSMNYGDDVDRPVTKNDGSHTYFASDIAYHFNKYNRGFSKMVNIWGADHAGYLKRVKGSLHAITDGKADLTIVLCQLVKLFRDGKPVTMSKRANKFITINEVVDEVGCDALRFMMLFRKNDAPLDFDFSKVTEKSRDNPVFYVQYAYARIFSVSRKLEEFNLNIKFNYEDLKNSNYTLLNDIQEIKLIKKLSYFPKILKLTLQTYEPHRIAYYLYELSSEFHSLWNKGNDNENLRFIISGNKDLTKSRLSLLFAISNVLKSGLDIIGVNAPKEMN
ncbi:MAG: arginine--tRNA ligase [Alphaproteobacteria bacterium]|jgi:arginyl-tRNA synthetase|tara:strand:+ start:8888 stop:10651 length:1764 start_codon:yes stop_codon:yes gene_type:complete